MRLKRLIAAVCFVLLAVALTAAEPDPFAGSSGAPGRWGLGISAISPGLPVALKGVWRNGPWGAQIEANWFYQWAMVRLDARRRIVLKGRMETYAVAGITFNHFNDGLGSTSSVNDTFWVDLAAGLQFNLGRNQRFSLGAEGGLLIPFYSNLGLEQYQNSGFIVANVFMLWWL